MRTIGKLSALAGVSADTLRYYEKEGLVRPAAKTAGGYRLYDDEALRRIRFIKQAQQCGFALADVKGLLALRRAPGACCDDVRSLAIEKRLQIERRLRSLQAMSRALEELIRDCDGGAGPTDQCAILNALESSLQDETR